MCQSMHEQSKHLWIFRLVQSCRTTKQNSEACSCATYAQTQAQEKHARLAEQGWQVERLKACRIIDIIIGVAFHHWRIFGISKNESGLGFGVGIGNGNRDMVLMRQGNHLLSFSL